MPHERIYDVLIVGAGPAGLSAAQTLGRCRRRAIVFDDGRQRNQSATSMHGFLSRDGISPVQFLALAANELAQYPTIDRRQAHISHAQRTAGAFRVRTSEGEEFEGRRLLLATGMYDVLPQIEGIERSWGRRVFTCPYCDAWEFRDKRLAVIGRGRKAVELAQEMAQWSDDLIVCMQGVDDLNRRQRQWLERRKTVVVSAQLTAMHDAGGHLILESSDGRSEQCDAAFLCAPLRQRYPLVEMLGCSVREDGEIAVNEYGRTCVDGCYAAGDAVTMRHQVVLAAASGVNAAIAINDDLIDDDLAQE